ncbi:MAG: hypothetical protein C4520_04990 [Candidatus Abyssobacteria bacterium SURF_5]|uniref:Uncharacterized protein n=1 Tax=Abyssobacteria bacterium (strain SURF_5) TaxID=2093360 RepID=A0A3A4NYW6_ABYX5|nr:MAG: hypothetical protein C4520_04990 [Candidatus Abyssubacteria bacterium SURF_5]
MQTDSGDSQAQKKCPLCGKTIKKSAYRCPFCHESLAEIDQQEWEDISSSDISGASSASNLKDDIFTPLSAALVIGVIVAFAIVVSFRLFSLRDKEKEQEPLFPGSLQERQGEKAKPPAKLVYPESQPAAAVPPVEAPAEDLTDGLPAAPAALEDQKREQRIQEVFDQIIPDIRKGEQETPDTVILKAGSHLECRILLEDATALKVQYKGVTTTIEKKRIDRVERMTPEQIEEKARAAALARAAEIVDAEMERERANQSLELEDVPAEGLENAPQGPQSAAGESAFFIGDSSHKGFLIPGDARVTRSSIKSTLGEPDLEYARVLDYNWKHGFELVLSENDVLEAIRINSDRFKGKLSSEISYVSSLPDVLTAYGEPSSEKYVESLLSDSHEFQSGVLYREGGFSRINYKETGLTFWFDRNRIIQIEVGRKG